MNNKKVLLVDDDEDMLILSGRELINAGYDIITARSGKQALKMLTLQKSEIMLLVLDVLIPDMDGRKLAKQVKDMNLEIPIIFYSNYGYKDKLPGWGISEDADYVIKGDAKKLLGLIRKRTINLSSKG